jgi:epoxyqueuosine reductase
LGFTGKNTCLIDPRRGSWLFLGVILTTAVLPPIGQKTQANCGSCSRCLEACPTHALVGPYVLDARRCISYLTIELKGPIPQELRSLIGNRIFGCDTCQIVCPWQRFAKPSREKAFRAPYRDTPVPFLAEIIGLDEASFRKRFEHTPLWRGKRRRLLRNTAVALGNWGHENAIPLLVKALHDEESLIRGHAAWGLGHIGGSRACDALEQALKQETDSYVRQEIGLAQTECTH